MSPNRFANQLLPHYHSQITRGSHESHHDQDAHQANYHIDGLHPQDSMRHARRKKANRIKQHKQNQATPRRRDEKARRKTSKHNQATTARQHKTHTQVALTLSYAGRGFPQAHLLSYVLVYHRCYESKPTCLHVIVYLLVAWHDARRVCCISLPQAVWVYWLDMCVGQPLFVFGAIAALGCKLSLLLRVVQFIVLLRHRFFIVVCVDASINAHTKHRQ